eukprot:jgi/Astpho2/9301/Aster-x0850
MQHGDAFKLRLGLQMTFLCSPQLMAAFFTTSTQHIAITPAVEQFTERNFGLPTSVMSGRHRALLAELQRLLAPAKLPAVAGHLLEHMQRGIKAMQRQPGQEVDLLHLVKTVLFPAAMETLFGPAFLREHGADSLADAYFAFDGGFELAASPVPQWVQPRWCWARYTLLQAFRTSLRKGQLAGTVGGDLLQSVGVPEDKQPNMLLAVMWASLANTVPGSFWAVGFLLQPRHADILRLVQQELSSPAAGAGSTDQTDTAPGGIPYPDQILAVALQRRSLLQRCVLEALRLRGAGVTVRMAMSDLELPYGDGRTLSVRKGEMLAVSPWESHFDERLFGTGAAEFNPHREGLQGAPLGAVPGVAGLSGFTFGGGWFRCPGRFLGEVEVALVVALFISRLRWPDTLESATSTQKRLAPAKDSLPAPETRRQVGFRWPKSPLTLWWR